MKILRWSGALAALLFLWKTFLFQTLPFSESLFCGDAGTYFQIFSGHGVSSQVRLSGYPQYLSLFKSLIVDGQSVVWIQTLTSSFLQIWASPSP
ncbi:MAG: hypothetical protein K2X47_16175 [Bdellovibrionales bacterium]|nr:hypothetical protein [Bdellovibrionales bacterium]